MNLKPTIGPRERILLFGGAGTGKSTAALSIARHCDQVTFHIIDNDYSYPRLLATEFSDLSNVKLYSCDDDDWVSQKEALRNAQNEADHDDWVVFDMLTPTWDAVQSWYTEQAFDKGIDEYFIEMKKARGKDDGGGFFEGWQDWPVINKQYYAFESRLKKNPCHLLCMAEIADTREGKGKDKGDAKDIKNLFGPYGVKPKGQKRVAHIFQTIILMTKERVGTWKMTTIKDRGRPELEDAEVGKFGWNYLFKVAGWKPGL